MISYHSYYIYHNNTEDRAEQQTEKKKTVSALESKFHQIHTHIVESYSGVSNSLQKC